MRPMVVGPLPAVIRLVSLAASCGNCGESRYHREPKTGGDERKLGGVFGGGVHDVRFVAQ